TNKLPKRKIWHQRVINWAFRDPFKLVADDERRHLVRVLISTAFALWEDALDGHLEFHDVSHLVSSRRDVTKPPGVDIDILFAKGSHGDKEAFDGRGRMVAHSAYPPGGILHLDADENWSFDGSRGVDLRY
ncbi:Matrixin, partial [Oesophagostomum dentatum]